MSAVTSSTRLVALLGDPVSHSLSPIFQNAAIQASSLDAIYLALRCRAEEVPGLIKGIAHAGGAGNVTVPHKELAANSVDRLTNSAKRTGACNTFWLEEGKVWGDNTDVTGVVRSVRTLLGESPQGRRVLVLGAGGSARGAVAAMLDEGAAEITVCNRSLDRARSLASAFGGENAGLRARALEEIRNERFDLAINATSLGLRPDDALPVPTGAGLEIGAALDLVYSSNSTSWVKAMRAAGIPAADGIEMLLRQGAASFERWWGRPAPLAEMRAALASHTPPER